MKIMKFTAWILICITSGSPVVCSSHGPRLNVTDELELDVSSSSQVDIVIRCEAQQDVTWNWPKAMLDNSTIKNHMSIIDYQVPDADYPFISDLKLINVSSKATGYYDCQHINSTGLDDQQTTANTYIYVFDGENGLAVSDDLLTINVDTSMTLVLPCTVTQTNISVNLIYLDEDISLKPNIIWNPKIGFIVNNLGEANNLDVGSGLYQCQPEGFNDSASFNVTINPAKDELDPPAIMSLLGNHFVVEYSFTLNCLKVKHGYGIRLDWSFPRINESDAYTIITINTIRGGQEYLQSSLSIKSATLKDNGEYNCSVSASGRVSRSDTYTVHVKETLEPFINLTQINRFKAIEGVDMNLRHDVIVFPPNPQVTYRYHDGREVNDTDARITFEYIPSIAQSWLRIKNITKDDFGVYILEVTSNDGTLGESTKSLVEVTSKPYTTMSVLSVVTNGSSITVECTAKGFPIDTVNMTLQIEYCSQGLHTCTGKFEEILWDDYNSTWPVDEGNVMRSFGSFVPESSGQIKCESQNNIGETSTTNVIRVSDIGEAFSFMYTVNDNSTNINSAKEEITIIENDQFHLLCGGIKFDFKEIDFKKRNDSLVMNIEDSKYSIVRKVVMEKVPKKYEGMYVCSADPHDKTKSKLIRRLDVTVLDEVAPVFIGVPNMAANEKKHMETGQNLILNCTVGGMPIPDIIWYKDDELFTVDNNEETIHMSENFQLLKFKFLKKSYSGTYRCHVENRKNYIDGQMILKVYSTHALSKGAVIGIVIAVIIIIALAVLIIWLYLRIKREKDSNVEFRNNEIFWMDKGNVGEISEDRNSSMLRDVNNEKVRYINIPNKEEIKSAKVNKKGLKIKV